jgi:hypothetical protein
MQDRDPIGQGQGLEQVVRDKHDRPRLVSHQLQHLLLQTIARDSVNRTEGFIH